MKEGEWLSHSHHNTKQEIGVEGRGDRAHCLSDDGKNQDVRTKLGLSLDPLPANILLQVAM
jgi:hypothetical protein